MAEYQTYTEWRQNKIRGLLKKAEGVQPVVQVQQPSYTVIPQNLMPQPGQFVPPGRTDRNYQRIGIPDRNARILRIEGINGTKYARWSDGTTTYAPPANPTAFVPAPQQTQMEAALQGFGEGFNNGATVIAQAGMPIVQQKVHDLSNVVDKATDAVGLPNITGGVRQAVDNANKSVQKMEVSPEMSAEEKQRSQQLGQFGVQTLVDAADPSSKIFNAKFLGFIPGYGRAVNNNIVQGVGSRLRSYGDNHNGTAGTAASIIGTGLDPAGALEAAAKKARPPRIPRAASLPRIK